MTIKPVKTPEVTELNEDLSFKLSIKTLISIGAGLAVIISMWFVLQADIQEAKKLPAPAVDRIEYDLKDQLIRETVMETQKDVDEIKNKLDKIEDHMLNTK